MRSTIRTLSILLFFSGMGCGSDEPEEPTEERLLAEKLGKLVEGQEGEHAPVTEQELKTWEASIRKTREEADSEVYAKFTKCMEEATVFAAAEACFLIVDPQENVQPADQPKTVDEICRSLHQLAVAERRDHEASMSMEYCRPNMLRLKEAIAANWTAFGRCALEAKDTLAFDGCQFDALPSAEEHCNAIAATFRKYEEPLVDEHNIICIAKIEARRASLPRMEHRVDLSCCLNLAMSPDDIQTCLNSTSPSCKPD